MLTLTGDYYRTLINREAHGLLPACLRGTLLLASVPYGIAVRARNRLYDLGWKRRLRAPVPVISVGNLILGGTGKTPCVEYVAGYCRALGRRVAILSRGYGGQDGRNDEALVLEENLPDVPHLQGADRVALAATAVEELESEVLVLDDGFQHRRLARDLDLLLLDTTNPWGFGHLFPRGWLREPAAGLRRADLVILTRRDQVEQELLGRVRERIRRLAPRLPIVEAVHRPTALVNADRRTADLARLRDRPVAAFCGIGNPGAFRRTLEDLGATVANFRRFPDHHAYRRADVEDLRRWAGQQQPGCLVVTTQKDLVKLRLTKLGSAELWALRICLHMEDGKELIDELVNKVVDSIPLAVADGLAFGER